AGTLSGNPLATAAGLVTLRRLSEPGVYDELGERSEALMRGFASAAEAAGVELATQAVGGMFGFFFHPGPVSCFEDAKKADGARFRRFFAEMLARGVYLAPSPFEAGFVSLAHGRREIRETLQAAEIAFEKAASAR
ncbi:MAG: aspartate aminotransferase family protein, partial [Myxococcota bacterium]|nr:aspartate aminotransferase family protein [Myxococcota bacterium]